MPRGRLLLLALFTSPLVFLPVSCQLGPVVQHTIADRLPLIPSHVDTFSSVALPSLSLTARKAVACGSDNYRIQPIYVSGSNQIDFYTVNRTQAINDVMAADDFLNARAVGMGGSAHLRLVTDGACNISLPEVRAPGPVTNLGQALDAARAAGYGDNGYRIWLLLTQTGRAACDGIAVQYGSSRSYETPDPTQNSANDPAQAHWAAAECLNSSGDPHVILHEITHNLGAVLPDAPHATGAGHCTDGLDTMCYNDGGPNGDAYTTTACSSETYDCGADDYFALHPSGWLASHWDTASSYFLQVTR